MSRRLNPITAAIRLLPAALLLRLPAFRGRAAVPIDETEDYRAIGYTDQRKIARDSRGNLFVAYRRKHRTRGLHRYHIFVARSADQGASWTVLNNNTPVERVGDYTQRAPAIAVDRDDVLHLVWYGNDAGNSGENERQIKYARSSDGGASWSGWINLAEVPGYAGQRLWQEHPAVHVGRAGDVYVVWQGMDATYQAASQVKFARSTDGGLTWSAWWNVSPASRGNRSRPTLVASRDGGRLYILAYGDVSGRQQILWTTSDDGGSTWAAWLAVATCDADQRHVSVALDSRDRLHAAWRQEDRSGKTQVHYAGYDGRSWSAPLAVGPNGAAYQFFPSIAVTRDDRLWLAWTESTGPSGYPSDDPRDGQVCYVSRPAGGDWSRRALLAARGDTQIYASLRWGRYDNGGNVDLVWLDNAGGVKLHIYHGSLGAW